RLEVAGDAPVGVAELHLIGGSRSAAARGRLGGGEGAASESTERGTGGEHDQQQGDEDENAPAPVDRRPGTGRRGDEREVPAAGCLRSSVGTGVGNGGHRTALLRSNFCSNQTTNACSASRPKTNRCLPSSNRRATVPSSKHLFGGGVWPKPISPTASWRS